MGDNDDDNGTDAKQTLKQTRNPHPDAAENASLPGWLYTLNSFLERAFTEADRATGC